MKAIKTDLSFVGPGCPPAVYRDLWDRLCVQLMGSTPIGIDGQETLPNINIWSRDVTLVSEEESSFTFTVLAGENPAPKAGDVVLYKRKYYVIGEISSVEQHTYTCTNCTFIDSTIVDAYRKLVTLIQIAEGLSAPTVEVVDTVTGEPGTNAEVTNSGDEHDAKLHFVIPRGQKGDPGANDYNDLINKPTIPDDLADLADDATHRLVTDSEKAAWNAKYDKPSGGIPSTDMTEGVQQSLGRADSAIQDVSDKADKDTDAVEGNVAAFDANGNPVDGGTTLSTIVEGAGRGYTAYQKPVGGIPKTDMTEAVQLSLGKADTAVQDVSGKANKSEMGVSVNGDKTTITLKNGTSAEVINQHQSLTGITELIPEQASSENQLADKQFVNSSIATATATFRGTYNLVNDLSLTTSATREQIATAIATKLAALSIVADNEDYVFVQIPTADATPTEIARVDRYKYNGTAWSYEWSLNNSSFTAAQWAALNSGITPAAVTKLGALPTNSELTTLLGGKVDKVNGKGLSANDFTDTLKNKLDALPAKPVDTETQSLSAAEQLQARTNIGATAPEVFWVIYGTTLAADIVAANTAGKIVMCSYNSNIYILTTVDNQYCVFTCANWAPTLYYIAVSRSADTWGKYGFQIERKDDKVTSWSGTPTNSKYPSEKLVKNSLDGKQATISDLQTIREGAAAGATAYQKPGTGIPASDLASAVQTSLSKADSAVQDVSDKEDKANKVTSLSDQSTDTQYPSAKATHDAIKEGSVKEAVKLTSEKKANQEFAYRTCPQTIGADALTLNSIKGKTLAWNQLANTGTAGGYISNTDTDTAENFDGKIQVTDGTNYEYEDLGIVPGDSTNVPVEAVFTASLTGTMIIKHNGLTQDIALVTVEVISGHKYVVSMLMHTCDPTTVGGITATVNAVTDLTILFNGDVPANFSVADFHAMFPEYSNTYNAGELINNTAKALETVGFNQCDEQWEYNGTIEPSTGEWYYDEYLLTSKNLIPVVPGETYYFKSPSNARMFCYDSGGNILKLQSSVYHIDILAGQEFVIPSNAYYMKFALWEGITYGYDICINLSNTNRDGEYEPYWKRDLPLNLASIRVKDPNNPYGILTIQQPMKSAGSVRNEIKDGKYVKRLLEVDLGDLTWDYAGGIFFSQDAIGQKGLGKAICAMYGFYDATDGTDFVSNAPDKSISICGYYTGGDICIKNTDYSAASAFKTAMAGVKAYIELATEEVYELAEPLMLSIPAGTTERIIADGLSAPMVCDMTYGVNPAQLLDDMVSGLNSTKSEINQVKEDKSNKVTSLSSSSTDDEYPSAKAVYDIVGDVETLLALI